METQPRRAINLPCSSVEAGKRTMGKIAVTESGESKHTVAHGERDREGDGDKPAQ